MPKKSVEIFRAQFAEAVRSYAGSDMSEARLDIAVWVTPEQLSERLMDELDMLHPFGQGNPEPVFGLSNVQFAGRPEIFKEQHFRFSVEDGRGRRLPGVAWKLAHRLPPPGVPIDLAVELKWNHYNGRKLLQLGLIDWRASVSS